jgi:hypothetical protein
MKAYKNDLLKYVILYHTLRQTKMNKFILNIKSNIYYKIIFDKNDVCLE